jgi:hypothetical protein
MYLLRRMPCNCARSMPARRTASATVGVSMPFEFATSRRRLALPRIHRNPGVRVHTTHNRTPVLISSSHMSAHTLPMCRSCRRVQPSRHVKSNAPSSQGCPARQGGPASTSEQLLHLENTCSRLERYAYIGFCLLWSKGTNGRPPRTAFRYREGSRELPLLH